MLNKNTFPELFNALKKPKTKKKSKKQPTDSSNSKDLEANKDKIFDSKTRATFKLKKNDLTTSAKPILDTLSGKMPISFIGKHVIHELIYYVWE